MIDLSAYASLFATAFIAATLFPLQSEVLFAGLVVSREFSPVLLLAAASVGNVGGSTVNWALGRSIEKYRKSRWFPVSEAGLARAQRHYQKYGKWTLLLSWLPVIGDPLTLVAGVMREPLLVFLSLVAAAKVGRYVAIMLTIDAWMR